MIIGKRNWVDCVLKIDHPKFEKVNSFKYLGLIVSKKKKKWYQQRSSHYNSSGKRDFLWTFETIKFWVIIKRVKETFSLKSNTTCDIVQIGNLGTKEIRWI